MNQIYSNTSCFIPEISSTVWNGSKLYREYKQYVSSDSEPLLHNSFYRVIFKNDTTYPLQNDRSFVSYPKKILVIEKFPEGFLFHGYLSQKQMHGLLSCREYLKILKLSSTLLVDSLGIDFWVWDKQFYLAERKVKKILNILNAILKKKDVKNFVNFNNILEIYFINYRECPYRMFKL